MLWGGVIASSLVVIAVFWFYPDSKSEIAKRAQTAPSQDSRPSELEDSPLKTAAATQTTTPTVTPTAFALPSKPRSIDTKTEQDRLLAKVEKLVVDYPHSADAMHIAAITYSELLQTDKAATFFKNSLALDNRSPQVLVDYARLLLQTGQQQAAVDLLEPAAISIGSAAIIDTLGNAYMQIGELEKAAETLDSGAKRLPNDSALRLRLAQVQLQLQQFEGAEKNARAAIDLGRADNAAFTALASALIRLGRREEALEIRGKTVSVKPQAEANDEQYKQSFQQFAAHTYGLVAGVYQANRQPAATEELLLESLALDPTAANNLLALGDMLYKQQRAEQAIQVYQRLVEVQPENLFNYNNLASLAVSIGNVPLAEDSLRRAAKADPTGNATLRLADFLLRLGNSAEASRQAEAAVALLGNADAYIIWISALMADGKTAAALSALLKARETLPGDDRLKNIQL